MQIHNIENNKNYYYKRITDIGTEFTGVIKFLKFLVKLVEICRFTLYSFI